MKFYEAAEAWELVQSGQSRRMVAASFGVSHTHLGRIFKQCLEHGRDAPYLNRDAKGRPRTIPVKLVKAGMVLRDKGMCWKSAARQLGVDAEQLRKSAWHYDNYRYGHG